MLNDLVVGFEAPGDQAEFRVVNVDSMIFPRTYGDSAAPSGVDKAADTPVDRTLTMALFVDKQAKCQRHGVWSAATTAGADIGRNCMLATAAPRVGGLR